MTPEEVWTKAFCAAASHPPDRIWRDASDRMAVSYAIAAYAEIVAERALHEFTRIFNGGKP